MYCYNSVKAYKKAYEHISTEPFPFFAVTAKRAILGNTLCRPIKMGRAAARTVWNSQGSLLVCLPKSISPNTHAAWWKRSCTTLCCNPHCDETRCNNCIHSRDEGGKIRQVVTLIEIMKLLVAKLSPSSYKNKKNRVEIATEILVSVLSCTNQLCYFYLLYL